MGDLKLHNDHCNSECCAAETTVRSVKTGQLDDRTMKSGGRVAIFAGLLSSKALPSTCFSLSIGPNCEVCRAQASAQSTNHLTHKRVLVSLIGSNIRLHGERDRCNMIVIIIVSVLHKRRQIRRNTASNWDELFVGDTSAHPKVSCTQTQRDRV